MHGELLSDEILERIALAEAEKIRTQGDMLKDGLFGPDDKRLCRVDPSSTVKYSKKAKPTLKVDGAKGPRHEIQGRPRTGKRH